MFKFTVHPAYVSVTDGIQAAANYMTVSWRKWLPVVFVYAVVQGLLYAAVIGDTSRWYYIDNYTGRLHWEPGLSDRIPAIALGLIALTVVSVVCSWVVMGVAVAGLRNRPVTIPWLVERGLRTIAAGILLAFAVFAFFFVLVLLTVIAPPIGIIAFLVGIVVLVIVALRLQFAMYAIFDGAGVIQGLEESWRLSRGSVIRILGWVLMGALLTGAVSMITGLVSAPMAATGEVALKQAIVGGVAQAGAVLVTFMTAVLFEFRPTMLFLHLVQPHCRHQHSAARSIRHTTTPR